jgi:hypothetical protein
MSNKRRDWYEDNKDDENLADVYPTVDFGGEYHDQEVDESEDDYYSITDRVVDKSETEES